MSSNTLSVPRVTFTSCIREQLQAERGEQGPLRLAKKAIDVLHYATEEYITDLMQIANTEASETQKRKTLLVKDLQAALQVAERVPCGTSDTILTMEFDDSEQ